MNALRDVHAVVGGRLLGLAALLFLFCAQGQDIEWQGYETVESASGSTVMVPDDSRGPRPVLVLLPFTSGSAADLLERWYANSLPAQARHRGLIVVVPSGVGSAADYASGAAWTATIKRYGDGIAADVAEVVKNHGGDPARVALAGYSMGGDLAWALIQRDRERYSGAVIMGSRATYREKGALERLAKRKTRLFYFMGESESAARVAGANAAKDAARRAGVSLRAASAPGEHVWAPPAVLAEAVDYVFEFEGALPAAAAGKVPAQSSASTRWPVAGRTGGEEDEAKEEEQSDVVRRRIEHRNAAGKVQDPATLTHARRPATTSERPEELQTCDWKPFEDEKTYQGWGYRDGKGRVVVPPRFSNADPFGEDGLAMVHEELEGGAGYMNCKGEVFNVFSEAATDEFSEGLVRFEDYTRDRSGNHEYFVGFLNRRGQVFLPAAYDFATSFCDDVARVGSDCTFEHDRAAVQMNVECAAWRYIDLKGRTVRKPKADKVCDEIRVEPRFSKPGSRYDVIEDATQEEIEEEVDDEIEDQTG